MQKEHGKKGLIIVLVTNNPASVMEPFLKQQGASNLAVAIGGNMGVYGGGKIPYAYLLDAKGIVVWQGHPGGGRWDSIALEALKKASAMKVDASKGLSIKASEYSSKFRSSIEKIQQKKYKSAISNIKSLARRKKTREKAEELLDKLKEFASGLLEQSKEMVKRKNYHDSFDNFKMLEKNFRAFKEIASQAKKARKEMESDKEIKKELAKQRNWSWVRKQNTIKVYKRYLAYYPGSSKKAEIKKRIIGIEVKVISKGEYNKIPKDKSVKKNRGRYASIHVKNNTAHTLTLFCSGRDAKKLVLKPGKSGSLRLLKGKYKVAASGDANNALKFYGKRRYIGVHSFDLGEK